MPSFIVAGLWEGPREVIEASFKSFAANVLDFFFFLFSFG